MYSLAWCERILYTKPQSIYLLDCVLCPILFTECLFFQSGCCKPSNDCNFTYVSPTNWTKSSTSSSFTNPDCNLWSNDPNVLCYSCESCKAGLLDNIKSDWKRVAVLNIIFLVFLILVYSVGCCAFRNNRRLDSYKRYP